MDFIINAEYQKDSNIHSELNNHNKQECINLYKIIYIMFHVKHLSLIVFKLNYICLFDYLFISS